MDLLCECKHGSLRHDYSGLGPCLDIECECRIFRRSLVNDKPVSSDVEDVVCMCAHGSENHDLNGIGECLWALCPCKSFYRSNVLNDPIKRLRDYDEDWHFDYTGGDKVMAMEFPCECGHDVQQHDKGTGECYISGCKCKTFEHAKVKKLDIDPEDLKMLLRGFQIMVANLENWSYVSTNAEYLEKKKVSDALEQMLSQFKPLVEMVQGVMEVEALTILDIEDLL